MEQRHYRVVGIILKRINYGEADKMVVVFTKEYGKIKVVAKGARRLFSRRAPHLELFNLVSLFLAKGTVFDIITEAETIKNFSEWKKNLEKVRYAYLATEILDLLCPEKQPHKEVYDVAVSYLSNLGDLNQAQTNANEFANRVLQELGYLQRDKFLAEPLDYVEQLAEKRLKTRQI